MGLKDMIAKVRATATGVLTRHRRQIDQGIDKIGEAANTRTGGRHQARIRKGTDRARAGLDKIDPDRPDPDGPPAATPGPR